MEKEKDKFQSSAKTVETFFGFFFAKYFFLNNIIQKWWSFIINLEKIFINNFSGINVSAKLKATQHVKRVEK